MKFSTDPGVQSGRHAACSSIETAEPNGPRQGTFFVHSRLDGALDYRRVTARQTIPATPTTAAITNSHHSSQMTPARTNPAMTSPRIHVMSLPMRVL